MFIQLLTLIRGMILTHNLLEVERTSHFNHNLHPFRLCETNHHVEIQDLDLDALAMEKGSPLAAP